MHKTRDALSTGRIDRLQRPAIPAGRTQTRQVRTLWYALYFPELNDCAQLHKLASVCQMASSKICLSHPHVLVLEVHSMLRYFGNFYSLKNRLIPLLQEKLIQLQQPLQFFDCLSPSADASALLVRSGINIQINDLEALKSALGKVPSALLPLNRKVLQRLNNCGLLYLRDIWRLPTAALRLRFGRELSECLELLLAQRPAVLERWQSAPVFTDRIDLEIEVCKQNEILWLGSQLLARMEHFLKKRQLATDQIVFGIYQQRTLATNITLNTRHASFDKQLWQMLLESRLQKIQLDCAITGINLRAQQFYPVEPVGASPVRAVNSRPQTETKLLEILASRLGEDQVFQLYCQPSHDPAVAGKYLAFTQIKTGNNENTSAKLPGFGYWNNAPCWLLQTPRKLHTFNGKPVYMTPLVIEHGPQRIESCWWTGFDIRRDYYVAHNQHGMLLWIYRDLGLDDWFLHGLFA